MVTGVEAVSLAVMVLFGIATAGFLAFMLRDVLARLAAGSQGTSVSEVDVADAQRLAMFGPLVFLLGFLVVVAAVVLDPDPVGGVELATVGLAIIVLAAAPMAVALHRVWLRT